MEIKIEKRIIEEPVESETKIESFKDVHHSIFIRDESFHSLNNCEIECWNKENSLLVPDKTKVTEGNLDHNFHRLHGANMLEVNSENFNPIDSTSEEQSKNKSSPKTASNKKKQAKLTKNKSDHIQDSYVRPIISQGSSKDFAPSKRRKHVYVDGLPLEKRRTSRSMTPEAEDEEKNEVIVINTKKASRSVTPKVSKKCDDLKTGTSVKKQPSLHKTQNLTVFQNKLLEKFDASKNNEEDSDKMFLLSLLPYVKQLNDDDRLNFRFSTLQFFKDVRKKKKNQTVL